MTGVQGINCGGSRTDVWGAAERQLGFSHVLRRSVDPKATVV